MGRSKLLDGTDVDPCCLAQVSLELHDWSDLNQPMERCHISCQDLSSCARRVESNLA